MRINSGKIIQMIREAAIVEFGIMITSIGTAIFYSTELGSSAMATCCDGLHKIWSIPYGNANTIVNVLLLILVFLLDKSFMNYGTLLCVFTMGPWINVFTNIFQGLQVSGQAIGIRVVVCVLGTAIMGSGVALYSSMNRGLGPMEGIMMYIRKRFHVSVQLSRIIEEALLLCVGIILGGKWGVGTVFAVCFCGPVVQKVSKLLNDKQIIIKLQNS